MIDRYRKYDLAGRRDSWRNYQENLRLDNRPERGARAVKAALVYAVLPVLILSTIYWIFRTPARTAPAQKEPAAAATPSARQIGGQADLQHLLEPKAFFNPPSADFDITRNANRLTVETSLDVELQQYLLERMDREHSRYIGIVAMEADTGRVLTMAGFNKLDPDRNPCIDSTYPAASIFKIVTASAAVEASGLSPDSALSYSGRKYTLYKSQLKERAARYSHQTTLRDSFAMSINPVFGRLGADRVGKDELKKYAEALGFNRAIPFDLPLDPSQVSFSETPFQWAEIASGFNRETTISPLHGAVIVATLLNGGRMVVPTVVDRIVDPAGHTLYRREASRMGRAVTQSTSSALTEMMTATVSKGTARKAFRGYRRDKVLSRLTIGGKTGSIFNKTGDARFDWFVGYATEKEGGRRIAVSVVVAHEKVLGTRAGQYARMVMRKYFGDLFVKDRNSAA